MNSHTIPLHLRPVGARPIYPPPTSNFEFEGPVVLNSPVAVCTISGKGIQEKSETVIGKDSTCTRYSKDEITVTLQDADLWNSFWRVGNEMIVTKPGR